MKQDSPFSVRLGPLRKGWSEFCKSRGVSEGEGIKLLIANAVKTTIDSAEIKDDEDCGKKTRVELRLTEIEVAAIKSRAKESGFTVNRWIVAMIRANLKMVPQLGDREISELAESNYQLSAIGRNLNMLTRDLKASPGTIEPYRFQVLEHLKKQINEHLKTNHSLIQANLARWKRPGR